MTVSNVRRTIAFSILVGSLATVLVAGSARAEAGISVSIGLPVVVVSAPPELVVVPQSMVYYAPEVSAGLFYNGGYWYTPYRNRWFRANAYNGPWVVVNAGGVPGEIVRLPSNYRILYQSRERIPYGQLKTHWANRERERREHTGEWKAAPAKKMENSKNRGQGHDRD